jgi:Holliday junction resolvase
VRRSSADYLEQATVEELAADLEGRGYRVEREAPLGDQRVDILAERGEERVAIEVKARSRLAESTLEVERLREAALSAGLSGFRVVVAVPPHAVDVTVDNLRSELLDYFVKNETSSTREALASVTQFDDVIDLVIESVELHPARIHVRGRAYLDVRIDDGLGDADGEAFAIDSLPFTFDLDLDPDLKIVQMHDLEVYTSVPRV